MPMSRIRCQTGGRCEADSDGYSDSDSDSDSHCDCDRAVTVTVTVTVTVQSLSQHGPVDARTRLAGRLTRGWGGGTGGPASHNARQRRPATAGKPSTADNRCHLTRIGAIPGCGRVVHGTCCWHLVTGFRRSLFATSTHLMGPTTGGPIGVGGPAKVRRTALLINQVANLHRRWYGVLRVRRFMPRCSPKNLHDRLALTLPQHSSHCTAARLHCRAAVLGCIDPVHGCTDVPRSSKWSVQRLIVKQDRHWPTRSTTNEGQQPTTTAVRPVSGPLWPQVWVSRGPQSFA